MGVLSTAWLLFIVPTMYRMWLKSLDSDWVESEKKGWRGKYVSMERRLGRAEHKVFTWATNMGERRTVMTAWWRKKNILKLPER